MRYRAPQNLTVIRFNDRRGSMINLTHRRWRFIIFVFGITILSLAIAYGLHGESPRRRAEATIQKIGFDVFHQKALALLLKFRPPAPKDPENLIWGSDIIVIPQSELPHEIQLLNPLEVYAEYNGLNIALVESGHVREEGILVTPQPLVLPMDRDPNAPQEIYKNIYWYYTTHG
jgi:hypothetical protein